MALAERVYICDNEQCRLVIDRHVNGALNLAALASWSTGSSSGMDACGDRVRPDISGSGHWSRNQMLIMGSPYLRKFRRTIYLFCLSPFTLIKRGSVCQ